MAAILIISIVLHVHFTENRSVRCDKIVTTVSRPHSLGCYEDYIQQLTKKEETKGAELEQSNSVVPESGNVIGCGETNNGNNRLSIVNNTQSATIQ